MDSIDRLEINLCTYSLSSNAAKTLINGFSRCRRITRNYNFLFNHEIYYAREKWFPAKHIRSYYWGNNKWKWLSSKTLLNILCGLSQNCPFMLWFSSLDTFLGTWQNDKLVLYVSLWYNSIIAGSRIRWHHYKIKEWWSIKQTSFFINYMFDNIFF